MRISIDRLYSREEKIISTIEEINNNELSRSNEDPVYVSYNKEHNVYVLLDGHHRVIEAYLAGKTSIEGIRDKYIPSTYNLDADENVKLMGIVKKAESENIFENGKDVPLVKKHLNKLEKEIAKEELKMEFKEESIIAQPVKKVRKRNKM